MAVSADGYVCRGPVDDMSWTGREDKRVFRALTRNCVLGAGSNTFLQMPPLDEGRTLVRITRDPREGEWTLGAFARTFPDGWLIGGQTTLLSAIEGRFVDRVVLSHVNAETGGGWEDLVTPKLTELGWRSRLFPMDSLSIVTWTKEG